MAFALVNVFANFGVPQILQSDNEQVMVADVLEELRKLGGFQLRRIMKYFPRQNGGGGEVCSRDKTGFVRSGQRGIFQAGNITFLPFRWG